ncbi:MAG: hypothetical protein FD123_1730 [Bacteroidetes bacterium]|nr:MAG: hypothetical protein FD123_1730 [Bacteroidota bacterium]
MRKYLPLLVLLFSSPGILSAQSLYTATITDQVPSNTFGVWKSTPMPGGSLLMCGTVGTGSGFLLDYNHSATANWYKTYSGFRDIFDARRAPDGAVFAAGMTPAYKLVFMKTDTAGNPLWTTERAGTTLYMNGFVIPKAGGGCLAGGGSFGLDTLFVCEFSSSGAVLWEKSYEVYLNVYQNHFAQPTSDNGLIICSTLGSAGGACLLKLDSLGNITWQKAYPGTGQGCCARPMDGGYFFTARGGNEHIAIQTDSIGNVLWSRVWPINYNGNIAESPFPVITQGNVRTVYGTRFSGNFTKGVVVSFDSGGNFAWTKTYSYSPQDNQNDVISAFRYQDHSLGITKIVPNSSTVWVVNADSSGTLNCANDQPLVTPTAGNYSAGPSSIAAHNPGFTWAALNNSATARQIGYTLTCGPLGWDVQEEASAFSTFPNPASASVHLKYQPVPFSRSMLLYNATGMLVLRQEAQAGSVQMEISTAALPSGIYFLLVENDRAGRYCGRFAVIH